MVFIGNLTALVVAIINKKANGVFISGDQSYKSTTELVETMMYHMSVQKSNIKIPKILTKLLQLIKPRLYSRLFGNFIISNKRTNEILNFYPPFSFDHGIMVMTQSFTKEKK